MLFMSKPLDKITELQAQESEATELNQSRRDLHERMQQARNRLRHAREDLDYVDKDLKALREKPNLDFYGNPTEVDKARLARMQETYNECEREVKAAEAELATAEKAYHTANDKHQALQRSLVEKPPAVSLKDLTNHLKDTDKAREEVTRLESLIQAQQSAINADDDTALSVARQHRLDVLGDIAEGRATDADLTKAEQALSKAEAATQTTRQAASRARETVEALTPRLDAARARLQSLEQAQPRLKALYLRTEAETAGKEYARLAIELGQAYIRINALGDLAERIEGGQQSFGCHLDDLFIPDVRLSACSELARDGLLNIVNPHNLDKLTEQERAKLEGKGITIA